uniref:Letm1 RBD domain-containing protein n=1 Tax=Onchocerca volvulus TaxID=6282 RepID=A0A8R1XTW8_ONCVO
MLITRNIQSSFFGAKLVPLDLRLKNGEIPQLLVPKLQMIIDNLANSRASSTANNQPKGLMARYESFLSRRYPKVHAIHKMVTNGCKWCWSDIKTYYRLKKDLRTKTRQLSELKRSELEILLQCPSEITHILTLLVLLQIPVVGESLCTKEELLKLAVIVILIPLPFTIYIIALAVVFFPQLILTRHFWTNDQRKRFWSISLKRVARMHFDPLRKYLQNLDVNLQASLEELKKLELPEMDTYSLGHLYHLSRLHRVSLLTDGVRGFHNRAEMLRYLDHSLKSEDTAIDMMSEQQLCEQFYLRRLQYDGLSEEKMKCLLKNWIQHMTDPRLKTSLLLHVPVFETALKNAAENLKPIQKC